MRWRVLGPVEVAVPEATADIRRPQQRAVLAYLLLNANLVTSTEQVVEALWGVQPPATARSQVQACVSQVRRALRGADLDGVLDSVAGGYRLVVADGELDLNVFVGHVTRARTAAAAGQSQAAADLLRAGLALWRGAALTGAAGAFVAAAAAALQEQRLVAYEELADIEVALGRPGPLVPDLRALVAAHPLRERLAGQLMLALTGCGQQAEALRVYADVRSRLAEELGVEPGAGLTAVHLRVLRQQVPVAAAADSPPTPSPRPPAPAQPEQALRREPAAAGATPAQLPAGIAAFTGRAQHLKQLDELLHEEGIPPAVVISAIAGTAGVGKTALAVHWAHRVRDRFDDGQLYVNLRGYAPEPPLRPIEALAGFLHALGTPAEQVPVDLEQAAALYRTLLADKRALVILDNAHTAEQVRPLLPGTPGCLVLVTSRDRLGGLVARDGATRLTLDVLAPDEADALLARIVGPDRAAAEPQALAELARLCGYLPLALRIAAANLTGRPQHSIAAYVAELTAGDRLGALAVDGDEQHAVRAAFDLSYAALAPERRRLFRLMGLVPGPHLTAPAAAALAGITAPQAAAWLDRLADAHLIDGQEPDRFVFHDLLRQYAAERAQREETTVERRQALGRLFDWYVSTADAAAQILNPEMLRLPSALPEPGTAFDDHRQALAWLDAERANLLAAAQDAAGHGHSAAAWLIADRLRVYLRRRGYTVDWLAVAQAGVAAADAADAADDPAARAAAHFNLGAALDRQDQLQLSIEHYTRALEFARRAGWSDGEATVLRCLGSAYWWSGQLRQAADHHRQALASARRTGNLAGQAYSLGNLGAVCFSMGRLQQAADHYAEALALCQELKSRFGEEVSLANLGETSHALGRLDDAHDYLTRALAMHREFGDQAIQPETLHLLAAVHRDAGRYTTTLQTAEAAVALAGDKGSPYEASAVNTLATIHYRLGHLDEAVEHHERALRLARNSQNRSCELTALIGLANANRRLGQLDHAHTLATQALALAEQPGYRLIEGQAVTALAAVYLALDQPDQAVEHARRALDIHHETGHRLGQARTHTLLSHAVRDPDQAAQHQREALALFTDIGAADTNKAHNLQGPIR